MSSGNSFDREQAKSLLLELESLRQRPLRVNRVEEQTESELVEALDEERHESETLTVRLPSGLLVVAAGCSGGSPAGLAVEDPWAPPSPNVASSGIQRSLIQLSVHM